MLRTKDDVARSYVAICNRLDHEAKVSADRISWALTLTAGFFTASAILISIIVVGKPPAMAIGFLLLMMVGIASLGWFVSRLTKKAVEGAYRQFAYLRRNYQELRLEFDALKLPRPTGDEDAHKLAMKIAVWFPTLLMICWVADALLALLLALVILTGHQDRLYFIWPTLDPANTAGCDQPVHIRLPTRALPTL